MRINSICIITENVRKLCAFYSKVLERKPSLLTLQYVEFDIEGTILAIYHVKQHNELAQEPVVLAPECHTIIELEVEDVKQEYDRLCNLQVRFAKHLTTQPWGTTSTYFYDPDGNLINFFSR